MGTVGQSSVAEWHGGGQGGILTRLVVQPVSPTSYRRLQLICLEGRRCMGLTVYATPDGFCFRLWESKHHGTTAPVRDKANLACRQLHERSFSYLARFSLIAQTWLTTPAFRRSMDFFPEMWVNKDPAAGGCQRDPLFCAPQSPVA